MARLIPLAALVAGCAGVPPAAPALDTADFAETESLFRTKDDGGPNGFWDYCDGTLLCDLGEGDCDTDLQCEAGLDCITNLGDNYNLHWTTDVCAPNHCSDGIVSGNETAIDFGGDCGSVCNAATGAPDDCRPGCTCAIGGGDCDVDSDCDPGLICGDNNGSQFGLHWSVDVCVAGTCNDGVQNGTETGIDFGPDCGSVCGGANGDQEGYCTPGCPCAYGEGDCDADNECGAGLSCRLDLGGRFGIDPLHDVCLSPFGVTDLLNGDLIISEVMVNPLAFLDSGAEWFELYNNTNNSINLRNLRVRDFAMVNFSVGVDLIVSPRTHVVFVRTNNTAINGGVVGQFDYPNTFALSDVADQIILEDGTGRELDRVTWTNAWTIPNGRSMVLGSNYYNGFDNNVSSRWCTPQQRIVFGNPLTVRDYASPGVKNRPCP